MEKNIPQIEDILNNSTKAEIIEKIGDALSAEGSRLVVIIAMPNEENNDLDVEVWQTGHKYAYEEYGLIMLGANIVEDFCGGKETAPEKEE